MLTPTIKNSELKVATLNLFNYLEPPNAFYEFERIYSTKQWQKKQRWISEYLRENQPDIIGFQEVFSVESLRTLVNEQGYKYFAVIDAPYIEDEFIYTHPVVAIASRYPIVNADSVKEDLELAQSLGLSKAFSFNRKVLKATIDIPHIGKTDCYVVHFKSKRPMLEYDEKDKSHSPEKTIIESLKAQVAGGWASSIQRGSEATLLMMEMINRREKNNHPMILMGDFNNTLSDGVLSHLLTNTLRFVSSQDCDAFLEKYCLNDAWDLYQKVNLNNSSELSSKDNTQTRTPTHYFAGKGSVLDYVLLSCEFDASFHDSLYQVSDYHTYDKHLINPIFDRDGESTDHSVVLVTLTLRS